jgi:hypothetical protein
LDNGYGYNAKVDVKVDVRVDVRVDVNGVIYANEVLL